MNLRVFAFIWLLPVLGLLNVARAADDHLKDFPPLVLGSGSKEAGEVFKNSSTTQGLYNKYYGYARMIKTGDAAAQKRSFKANLDKDLPYWKSEAAREFDPPTAPTSKDKKVQKAYAEKVAKLRELYDRKKSVADIYVRWLGTDLPAWLEKV